MEQLGKQNFPNIRFNNITMYTNGITTISGKRIVVNGCVILNPTEEQLAQAGWTKVTVPQPSEEDLARIAREGEIENLKEQLAQGDYKIIKCYEAQLMNKAMPYDFVTLISERDALRERINELENVGDNEQ